jgi:hypothetical protein
MKTREELVKAVVDARAAYAAVYFGDATTAKWGYDPAWVAWADKFDAWRSYESEE